MRTPEIFKKLLPKKPPKDPFKEGLLRFFQTGEDPHLPDTKLYKETLWMVKPDGTPDLPTQGTQSDGSRGRS